VARLTARGSLALLGLLVAAGLLIAAEPMTLRELRAGAAVVPRSAVTAGAHHGYALLVLGVALLVLGVVGVVRRSVPAAAAALVVALCAAFLVAAIDGPALDDTGLVGPGRELARAHAGPAWRIEVAGAVLALAGAGGTLAFVLAPEAVRRRSRRQG
jgi:hypothetical protein